LPKKIQERRYLAAVLAIGQERPMQRHDPRANPPSQSRSNDGSHEQGSDSDLEQNRADSAGGYGTGGSTLDRHDILGPGADDPKLSDPNYVFPAADEKRPKENPGDHDAGSQSHPRD
jgi:hypothetical protein